MGQHFSQEANTIKVNDWLRLASTFHSMHAIAGRLSPAPVGPMGAGIETLETDTFRLQCFQTPTGIKLVMIADPRATNLDATLRSQAGSEGKGERGRQVYSLYSDYVLKNPFYETEMPIQCDLFTARLDQLPARP